MDNDGNGEQESRLREVPADPATDSLYAVDVTSGAIRSAELPHTPNEISGVA